jgi:hypothetical protein
MSLIHTHSRLWPLVVVVAAAALAGPAALAAQGSATIAPDDGGTRVSVQSSPTGSSAVVPDLIERYLMSHPTPPIAPDDRDTRVVFQSNPARSPIESAVASDRFHWADAGIGAAGAFALIVLTGGLVIYAARRSRTRLAGF